MYKIRLLGFGLLAAVSLGVHAKSITLSTPSGYQTKADWSLA